MGSRACTCRAFEADGATVVSLRDSVERRLEAGHGRGPRSREVPDHPPEDA